MKIIPVIDLKGGVAVRGVAGRREEYRPVESQIVESARPADVALAFSRELHLHEAYVADLDAIGGAEPAWETYRQIAGAGPRLWIDAGLRDVQRTASMIEFDRRADCLAAIIAGLETLPDAAALAAMLKIASPERLVLSLDLEGGRPLAPSPAWRGMTAEQIAAAAIEAGVARILILDLARVGVGQGVGTESLCRAVRAMSPDVELIAGGGIRNMKDVRQLQAAGCDAVLVASALHDGRMTREDLIA